MPTDELITVEEAAQRLGVSVATVRRRCAKGDLVCERESAAGNARLLVRLLVPEGEQPRTHVGTQPHDQLTVHVLEEVSWLRQELERRDQELAEMRRLLLQAQQHPRDVPVLPSASPGEPTAVVGHRPLWSRLLDRVRHALSA